MSQVTRTNAERVLIVEDEETTRSGLAELVRSWGYAADEAGDGAEALERITEFRPTIIVSDLIMPRMNGLELLRAIREDMDNVKVILLTAQGTVDTAVEAVKAGAEDYLSKPVDPQRLRRLLDRLTELNAQKRENQALRRQLTDRGRFGRIIGHSPVMRAIYRVIEQAAPTPASILILGESGTGKELVAQTIHQLSPRADAPFVGLNCAAIPETLLESEIFGHEKGAFTGAMDRRAGCFELADRGTLFLDEIAEMAPGTQVKLLRVLQERRFRRLGGRVEQEVDVRVIAATNVKPEVALRDGRLREDLYYRLNVFSHRAAAAARSQAGSAAADPGVHRRVQHPRPSHRPCADARKPCGCSPTTTGRATCASCATSSSAPRFSRAATTSSPSTCRRWAPCGRAPPRPPASRWCPA